MFESFFSVFPLIKIIYKINFLTGELCDFFVRATLSLKV